jgi:hypothetical protein
MIVWQQKKILLSGILSHVQSNGIVIYRMTSLQENKEKSFYFSYKLLLWWLSFNKQLKLIKFLFRSLFLYNLYVMICGCITTDWLHCFFLLLLFHPALNWLSQYSWNHWSCSSYMEDLPNVRIWSIFVVNNISLSLITFEPLLIQE